MGRRLGGVDSGPLPVAARFAHRFEDTPDYGFARCAKSDISDVIVAGGDMAGIRIAEYGRTIAHSQNNRTHGCLFHLIYRQRACERWRQYYNCNVIVDVFASYTTKAAPRINRGAALTLLFSGLISCR